MNSIDTTLSLFIEKAKAVSAIVAQVPTARDAFEYTVRLCSPKEACKRPGASGGSFGSTQDKTIAAPDLPEDQNKSLEDLCRAQGIQLINHGLGSYLTGIDIGLTYVDFGIAETGTLVIESSSEEIRLATMISQIHVALLPRSLLRRTTNEVESALVDAMDSPPNYTAFITGASRTADIERVLALGVHGPLELHILILEEA